MENPNKRKFDRYTKNDTYSREANEEHSRKKRKYFQEKGSKNIYGDDYVHDRKDGEYLKTLSQFEREQILFKRWEAREDQRIFQKENDEDEPENIQPVPTESLRYGQEGSNYEKYSEDSDLLEEARLEKRKERIRQKNMENLQKKLNNRNNRHNGNSQGRNSHQSIPRRKQFPISSRGAVPVNEVRKGSKREICDLAHMRKVMLTRNKIFHHVGEIYFKKMCKNSYVRVYVGENNKTSERVYRIARIVGFKHRKKGYTLHKSKKKIFINLLLEVGKSIEERRIDPISNSDVTQHEFDMYLRIMRKVNMRIPTNRTLKAHYERCIRNISINYNPTPSEIQDMINEKILQGRFEELSMTQLNQLKINISEKIKIISEKKRSKRATKEDVKKLNELYEREKKIIKIRDKKRGKGSNEMDNTLNKINKKAQSKNYKQKIKRRKNKNKIKKNKKKDMFDPFKRKETESTFFDFLEGLKKKKNSSPLPIEKLQEKKKNKFQANSHENEKEKEQNEKEKENEKENEKEKKKEEISLQSMQYANDVLAFLDEPELGI